ncbi:cyclic AMP-responsive element-binding protein 3 isoform X3 [Cuculus canorus]|uniref:cyclic AMP-responsive element-binding protein 3 isoform X3 n=1 Tax=Cuculus canorus TaxID=55661 RepID=UPI0023AB30EE|nr:cyclic AMP-responsive element-binding protein 3 isoform X3 [Cuculus canorus]
MSCSDELADEDLLDFILRDDVPCSKIPVEESGLLEDCNLQDLELWDKELDNLISSVLSPTEDKAGTLQGCYPADSDSGISEYHHVSHSPGSSSSSSLWSTDIVQVDHNYSLHEDCPGLQSVRPDMAQKDLSMDFGTWMCLEGTSKALEQTSSFPTAVDVDKGPQFFSEAIMQSSLQVGLAEEERQLLEKEGVALPSCLPLTRAEEQLLKKVHSRIRKKQSAQNSRCRRRMYVDGLEYRGAACTAQNHRLAKKVQLLTKQNMLLLKRLQELQALVRKSTTKTMTRRAYTMVVVLSFCSILTPRSEPEELRVLSQQIREFSGQLAPHLQEDSVVKVFNPEPEDPFMSGSHNMSQEEGQSPPNPDAGFSFYSRSSSDPLATMGSELSPPQPQVQCSQSNYLQVAEVWKAKGQEQVQHTAGVVIQQHCADDM